jgi:hypothetical protein
MLGIPTNSGYYLTLHYKGLMPRKKCVMTDMREVTRLKQFSQKYVLTNPETGAQIFSEEFKTWEAYNEANVAELAAIQLRRAERKAKVHEIVQAQQDAAKAHAWKGVRKPLFDRYAAFEAAKPSIFGQMIAAEMQKAGM